MQAHLSDLDVASLQHYSCLIDFWKYGRNLEVRSPIRVVRIYLVWDHQYQFSEHEEFYFLWKTMDKKITINKLKSWDICLRSEIFELDSNESP